MRVAALDLMTKGNTGTGLLWVPEPPRPRRPLSFRERGFSFIELRQQHLNLLAAIYGGRTVAKIDEVVGRAMVDDRYLPLGVVCVYFQPGGKNWLYAHFGPWLRTYPKDILRALHGVCDFLRANEVFVLHCSADESIEGSEKLARWLGGVPTGEYEEALGPIFRLDLRRTPI